MLGQLEDYDNTSDQLADAEYQHEYHSTYWCIWVCFEWTCWVLAGVGSTTELNQTDGEQRRIVLITLGACDCSAIFKSLQTGKPGQLDTVNTQTVTQMVWISDYFYRMWIHTWIGC